MYLFIDTTDHLVLGLLDSSFKWVEYVAKFEKKNSGRIHGEIYDLLSKHGLEVLDLEGVIQISGPGSYTGMRLSEGIVQVMEWNKIPAYSIHHFSIPKMLSDKPFAWIANAFKGEVFVYHFDGKDVTTSLIERDQLMDVVNLLNIDVFTHYAGEEFKDIPNLKSTGELLKEHGAQIFADVVKNKTRLEAYYYRELEKEFKVSFK